MKNISDRAELSWDAPGPGPWEIEGVHFPKPFPRFGRARVVRGFRDGFREGTSRYGLLLSHFEIGFVNDFWYQQPIAFGAPKGAKGPPPGPVLWLLTRMVPAMRKRIANSARAFENRIWHEDLRRWDEEDKPHAMARHRDLLAVEPAQLTDAELLAHLEQCEAHVEQMVFLHHRYTIPCCVPVGDFLAHASSWTGKSAGEILDLLRGSTPISLGFSATELQSLAESIRSDGNQALLSGGDPRAILDALRRAPGRTGEAARAFLSLVWHRAVSYDVSEKATGEMPEILVGAIRAAVARTNKPVEASRKKADALRELVPAEHRARFDELLSEARAINRLRDERGLYADCWAVGIARRALLELGRRLIERGKLENAEHAVDLDLEEARALLSGKAGPSAEAVARRARWRTSKTVADAPAFVGGQPAPPPPASLLPPAARRAALAVDAVLSNLFKDTEKTSSKTVIRGISVNDGVYEGTARLVSDASEFGRLQQGDVLVTRATAPYFNVVLPLLGAIVTDRGGQLCHAAIVAREYGIPGVVGTKEATQLIPDGARVVVDGSLGEIRILSQ
jgi:pyruvate,water dikinase